MMTLIKNGFLIIALAVLFACQSTPREQDRASKEIRYGQNRYVTVEGTQFQRYGLPYYFTGTNFWYGAYLGADPNGQKRLQKELDQLRALGVNNLRVLALSEKTDLTMAVSPAIQSAPGVLNERLLVGLDVLLDEMAKRDMVAVLYLNNFWQWSGGMAQYQSWLTGEPPFDPDVTGDWNGFMQNSAKFYRSEEAQTWYRAAIQQLVTRINTVNGKKYSDDPAIMAWQLANEPRPGSDEQGRNHFSDYKEWIESTARYIKSLDRYHLVSTGSEGEMGTVRDIDLYREAHSSDQIDYITFHLWPKNWSWLDIKNTEGTYQAALAKSKAYILRHIEIAKTLAKPTVLEEFGIERDLGDFSPNTSTSVRDAFFQEIFSMIEVQAKLGAPIAGTNFWTWGGLGKAKHADFIWREGDPYTGDPPQEAQGLNSVFSTDDSTLEVIHNHAEVMNSL